MQKITIHNPEKVITKNEVFTARNQEPKIKEVESEGKDILDYRIEEAKYDQDGNIIVKNKPPFYETTGRSLEWSIKKGETLTFPDYVAKYLMKIYPFLQEVEELKETKELEPTELEEITEAKPISGQVNCKYCGKYFTNERALGLHIGHKHLDKIL